MSPLPPVLSAECRIVFRSAGPGDASADVAALSRGPIDWVRTLYIAEKEAAGTALWRALERGGADAVPVAYADRLRRLAMVSDFRMMRLSERLRATIQAFREHGLQVILLKGAALGAMTDATFRERPMIDIDLLVRKEDVGAAADVVLRAGWLQHGNPALPELMRAHHHLPPFVDPVVPDLRLELHVAMLPSDHAFTLGDGPIWHDARPAPAPFEGSLLPSPHHLLFHACTHFAWSHAMRFGAWRTLRVVNSLMASGSIDWPSFTDLAVRSGAGSYCYWTLRMGQRMAGLQVPPQAMERLAVPSREWMRRALERHFIGEIATGEWPMSPSLRLSRALWRLAMQTSADGNDTVSRWQHDSRWASARPTESASSQGHVLRHLKGLGRWWNFASRTLVPLNRR